jgi:hypothetical protein
MASRGLGPRSGIRHDHWVKAFSSEVDTGSVKKTRQIKNLEPRFDSIETEKALEQPGEILRLR